MENNVTTPNAPGKGLLKVTGILMVIFSSIVLLIAIFGMIALGAMFGALGGSGAATASTLLILLAILPGIFEFVAGILGIVNANKPEKAGVCLAFGIIVIVLVILSIISNGFEWSSPIGLVLPILFIIGAIKNRQPA
jgi:peptidoglycan/LPS O-acetylase OafA/YrhL